MGAIRNAHRKVALHADLARKPILGDEFQVNTYTTGDQIRPAVVATTGTLLPLSAGFVVVWQSMNQNGTGW